MVKKRYLTEREKKLRARRKQAEELIEWKKKLDEEELRVREIERRAKAVLASKPTPATIPTTSNTLTAGKSKKQTAAASITSESEATTPRPAARVNTKLDEKITNDEDNSYIETFISAPSTSRIHTQIENGNSSNRQQKSTTTNTNLVSESIQTQFEKDSSHSIQENIITATETNKTSSSSSATSSSSSMSEIVTTTSAHSAKDLEFKVRELKNQLLKKKSEAEQLKKSLKAKEKTKLKEKENDLRKKIESYDVMIDKMKTQLDRDETSETTSQTPPVMRRATAQPQPSTHHTAPNVVTQPQTQVATAAKKQNANVTPAPRKTVVHEENESPRRRAFKSLNDDDIKTDTINDQLDELSSAPSTSRQQSEHMMVYSYKYSTVIQIS